MLRFIKKKIKYLSLRKKVRIGKDVNIAASSFEGKNTLFDGVNIHGSSIGLGTYIQKQSVILNCLIGRYCSIADHVYTCIGTHPTNFISTYPSFYYDTTSELGYSYYTGEPKFDLYKYPDQMHDYQIKIGNDVWIGSHVLIMGGVNIGNGAIIAAGSVVTKSVPPYQIWGGVPAKYIRHRFDEETVLKLEGMKWWNNSEKWIVDHINAFTDVISIHNLNSLQRPSDSY